MNNKICIAALLLGLIVSGCTEIIEKEPQAQISEFSAFVTAADAKTALTAAYQPLYANNWCCSNYGSGYMHWVLGNVASDDTEKGGESGSDQLYAQQISLFNIPTNNLALDLAWSSQYVGIRRANLVLDKVATIEMDVALKNRYLAEAKFLRAWYYMNLVKTFGDVPLVLTSTLGKFDLTRTPKQQVYNQIITDLEEAIAVLPEASGPNGYAAADRGRATKGAALAYLGKAYLYMDDFVKAETAFGTVINSGQYSLSPDYFSIFSKAGETNKEHIFQVQFFNSGANPSTENILNIVFGSRARNGWGFNLPTQDFVDAFEPGDPRLGHTVYKDDDVMPDGEIANVGNSPTGYLNKKYYVPHGERVNGGLRAGKDDIYMRLGKVLLWYAEAANENGNTTAALNALEQVRNRAREGNAAILPLITETNKDALRQLIWKEQRVEFGQEFERFFELVRQKRAGTVLRAYAQKYNVPKGAGFVDGVNEVFPIPQTEVNVSKGILEQNPGY